MKAIVLSGFGDRTALQLADVPVPEPGPGEVLVRHEYIGVNFFDVYMREGLYARSPAYGVPLPFCLGIEGAGVVVSTGANVADLAVGDRVAYCEALGSYAEFAAVPDHRAIKLPPKIDTREAAAIMLQGLTAHFLTHSAFPLAPGHVCLVHAATGGVGQLLTRLARARGARVLATVGSDEKATRGAVDEGQDPPPAVSRASPPKALLPGFRGAGCLASPACVPRERQRSTFLSARRSC